MCEWIIKEKIPAAAAITSTLFVLFQRVLHQRFIQVLVLENTVGILMVILL